MKNKRGGAGGKSSSIKQCEKLNTILSSTDDGNLIDER